MQMKYLRKINDKFKLPVAVYPLMDDKIKGIEKLRTAEFDTIKRGGD